MFAIQIGAAILPPILIGIVAYVTYVVIVLLCIEVWISPPPNHPQQLGSAAVVLTFFCLFLTLMASSFFKTLYHAYFDPGILGKNTSVDPESHTNSPIERLGGLPRRVYPAPTLEMLHEQAFYECDEQGNPLWCKRCEHWKPNRAHHSRMLDRCILKFDHYCAWVGGYTTFTNFRPFAQFSVSAAVFSLITLVSITIPWNNGCFEGHDVAPHLGLTAGFAGFFLCLAGGTGLSACLLAGANLTTIDNASGKKKVWRLAVRMQQAMKKETSIPGNARTFTTENQLYFAVLELSPGSNPYDSGRLKNWKSVMGPKWWDWILPSPTPGLCLQSRTTEPTPAVAAAVEKAGLGDMDEIMRERWKRLHRRQEEFPQLLAAAGAPLRTISAWRQARRETAKT